MLAFSVASVSQSSYLLYFFSTVLKVKKNFNADVTIMSKRATSVFH